MGEEEHSRGLTADSDGNLAGEGEENGEQPIRLMASDCSELFADCISRSYQPAIDQGALPLDVPQSVKEYHRRFESWCTFLGVYSHPIASLDYRLRRHSNLQDVIMRLLDILRQNLFLVTLYGTTSTDKNGKERHSGVVRPSINVDKATFTTIKESITRLNRVGILIRSSSRSTATARARRFAAQNPGLVLMSEFEERAYLALHCLYPHSAESLRQQLVDTMTDRFARLQYELYRTGHANVVSQPSLLPHSSKDEDEKGVIRNTEDDRQVGKHTDSGNTKQEIKHAPPVILPASSIDTARVPTGASLDKAVAPVQQSNAAKTLTGHNGRPREPDLPNFNQGEDYTPCAWCFQIIDRSSIRVRSNGHVEWSDNGRRHYRRDLLPYVCLAEGCRESRPAYSSSRDWFDHMSSTHTNYWLHLIHDQSFWECKVGHENDTTYIFSTKDEMCDHIGLLHQELFPPSIQGNYAAFDSVIDQYCVRAHRRVGSCPLCLFELDKDSPLLDDPTRAPSLVEGASHKETPKQMTEAPREQTSPADGREEKEATTWAMGSHIADHLHQIMIVSLQILTITNSSFDGDGETVSQSSGPSTGLSGPDEDQMRRRLEDLPEDLQGLMEWSDSDLDKRSSSQETLDWRRYDEEDEELSYVPVSPPYKPVSPESPQSLPPSIAGMSRLEADFLDLKSESAAKTSSSAASDKLESSFIAQDSPQGAQDKLRVHDTNNQQSSKASIAVPSQPHPAEAPQHDTEVQEPLGSIPGAGSLTEEDNRPSTLPEHDEVIQWEAESASREVNATNAEERLPESVPGGEPSSELSSNLFRELSEEEKKAANAKPTAWDWPEPTLNVSDVADSRRTKSESGGEVTPLSLVDPISSTNVSATPLALPGLPTQTEAAKRTAPDPHNKSVSKAAKDEAIRTTLGKPEEASTSSKPKPVLKYPSTQVHQDLPCPYCEQKYVVLNNLDKLVDHVQFEHVSLFQEMEISDILNQIHKDLSPVYREYREGLNATEPVSLPIEDGIERTWMSKGKPVRRQIYHSSRGGFWSDVPLNQSSSLEDSRDIPASSCLQSNEDSELVGSPSVELPEVKVLRKEQATRPPVPEGGLSSNSQAQQSQGSMTQESIGSDRELGFRQRPTGKEQTQVSPSSSLGAHPSPLAPNEGLGYEPASHSTEKALTAVKSAEEKGQGSNVPHIPSETSFEQDDSLILEAPKEAVTKTESNVTRDIRFAKGSVGEDQDATKTASASASSSGPSSPQQATSSKELGATRLKDVIDVSEIDLSTTSGHKPSAKPMPLNSAGTNPNKVSSNVGDAKISDSAIASTESSRTVIPPRPRRLRSNTPPTTRRSSDLYPPYEPYPFTYSDYNTASSPTTSPYYYSPRTRSRERARPIAQTSSQSSREKTSPSLLISTSSAFQDEYVFEPHPNKFLKQTPGLQRESSYASYSSRPESSKARRAVSPPYRDTEEEDYYRTRTPRRTTSTKPTSANPKASKASRTVVPKATEEDARKAGIPKGYSIKNWDPEEEPILLLGSVFDANSLGKWMYDWTVYKHGPATPLSDMAGEMWLLLIQLAGKIKRAEEIMPRIRSKENRDMVEDFVESGDRLFIRFSKLLKICEAPMLKVGESKQVKGQLGQNSGVEFVDTLFGRDRELERTEKFMSSVRLWNLRFEANCEEILRSPTS